MVTKIKDFLCHANPEALAWRFVSIFAITALAITGITLLPLEVFGVMGLGLIGSAIFIVIVDRLSILKGVMWLCIAGSFVFIVVADRLYEFFIIGGGYGLAVLIEKIQEKCKNK